MTINTDNTGSVYGELGLKSSKDVATRNKTTLGQEDFLSLMTTQLKNQDPFKPMESGEFLGQMAQFSTVSGINGLQESFTSVASSLYSNQALQASSLVGRSALVAGDRMNVADGTQLKGAIELPATVNDLSISIIGPAGELVNRYNLGIQAEGLVDFQWDGIRADGQRAGPGTYKIAAEATVNGEPGALQTYVQSHISSINLSKGDGIALNITGVGVVPFEQIKQVRE